MDDITTVTVYGSNDLAIATATFTNNDMFTSVDNTFGGMGFGWFDNLSISASLGGFSGPPQNPL